MPDSRFGELWTVTLDTASPDVSGRPYIKAGSKVPVEARSLLVLLTHEDGVER